MAKNQNTGKLKMDRKKTKCRILEKAKKRINSIESFAPDLNFGNDKSLNHYKKLAEQVEEKIKYYNQKMAEKTEAKESLKQAQKQLAAMNTEMLAGIKAIYGRDSNEYELMGGTRYSKRKPRESK